MTDPSIRQQQQRERRERLKRLGIDQEAQEQRRLRQQRDRQEQQRHAEWAAKHRDAWGRLPTTKFDLAMALFARQNPK